MSHPVQSGPVKVPCLHIDENRMRQRRTYDKIGCDEECDALAGGLGTVVCYGEAVEIHDVRERVDRTPNEDRPAGSFV